MLALKERGTRGARDLLKRSGAGVPEARLTREASLALARLADKAGRLSGISSWPYAPASRRPSR